MKKLFKIKSITDVITNSSTEVFQRYDESSFDTIKKLVNSILKFSGSNLTFDDLYEFSYDIELDCVLEYYEDYLIKNNQGKKAIEFRDADWQKQMEMLENENYELKVELARKYDNDHYDEGYPSIRGYVVSLKRGIDVENKELAKDIAEQLSGLDNIFENYASYC